MEGQYSEVGSRAYSPRVLVKLLLYGKMRGIRSSRRLAQAVKENVRFMYLAQGENPDFRTINRFRKRFSKELGCLFVQTVQLGMKSGYIKGDLLCVDGTKLGAFASDGSFVSEREVEERLRELEEEAKLFEEDSVLDEKEDELYGDDDGEPKLVESCRDAKELRAKLRRAIDEFKKLE